MSFRAQKPRRFGSPEAAIVATFGQINGGADAVAALLGKSRATAYAYTEPASSDEHVAIAWADVCRIVQFIGAVAPVEHLAGLAGGAFLPPVTPSTDTLAELHALSADAFGELTAEIIRALEDDSVCTRERHAILRKLQATLRPLLQAHALLTTQDQAAMAAE